MKAFGVVAVAVAMGAVCVARAEQALSPPVGYVSIEQRFDGLSEEDEAHGFQSVEYGVMLNTPVAGLAGTFWANQFDVRDSEHGLPANHAGGQQGGYLGIQVEKPNVHLAIFSLWWATEAEAGPGAECVADIEAWYNDEHAFEPAITSMETSDPRRSVSGGPFYSCRLPVTLKPGVHYRLRLAAVDGASAEEGAWWGAWLVDEDAGTEQLIGKLKALPGWGGIDPTSSGFIEHFVDLPKGCATIPASETVFAPAVANDGASRATIEAALYGDCADALKPRFKVTPGADGEVAVHVGAP